MKRKTSPTINRNNIDELSIEIEPPNLAFSPGRFESHLKPVQLQSERPKPLSIKELVAKSGKIKKKENLPAFINISDDIENPDSGQKPNSIQTNNHRGQTTLDGYYPTVSNFLQRAYSHPNKEDGNNPQKMPNNRSPNRSPQRSPVHQQFFNHQSIQEHLNAHRYQHAHERNQQISHNVIPTYKVTEIFKPRELTEQERKEKLAQELKNKMNKGSAQAKDQKKSNEELIKEEIKKKAVI